MARGVILWALKPNANRHQESLANVQAMLQVLLRGYTPPEPSPNPGPTDGHFPYDLDENGRIVVADGTVPSSVSEAIKRYWPREVWGDAARVSWGESKWERLAERNTLAQAGGQCSVPIGTLLDGTPIISERSIGIFQVNMCAHGRWAEYWQDIDNNVKYGAELWAEHGWYPWVWTATNIGLIRRG